MSPIAGEFGNWISEEKLLKLRMIIEKKNKTRR